MSAEAKPRGLLIDYALDGVRWDATNLALAVVGLGHEIARYELKPEELQRRMTALGILAGQVLLGTEKLEAAMNGKEAA